MNRTEEATADGESSEFNHDRTECEQCGSDIYYEPRIRHGTQYEATSGWNCTRCSWSKIDPDSGRERPSRTEHARRHAQELRSQGCDECGSADFEAVRVKEESDDPRLDFESYPTISCVDCGAVIVDEPEQALYKVVDE